MTTNPLAHCKHWIFDMDGTLTLAVHDFDEIRKSLGIVEGKPILEAISEMTPDGKQLQPGYSYPQRC